MHRLTTTLTTLIFGILLSVDAVQGQTSISPEYSSWNDHFGHSLSSDGVWIAVGMPQDSSEASLRGSVHIYWKNGDTWLLHQRISPDPIPGSGENLFFGTSVSLSGDLLLVGAPGDDEVGINAGSAHVFQLQEDTGLWEETDKLFSTTPAINDRLGTTVSIHAQLGLAIAGQLDADGTGELHTWTVDGSNWVQQEQLSNPSGESNTKFGISFDFDGSTLIAGAPDEQGGRGSVWIMTYESSTNNFTVDALLQPDSSVLAPHFGSSVSISGNAIVIGSPHDGDGMLNGGAAYLFKNLGNGWIAQDKFMGFSTEFGDAFGSSVQLVNNSLVVGAPFHNQETGDAYSFDVTGTTAVELLQLMAHDSVPNSYFGYNCHIANETIFVSALSYDNNNFLCGKLYLYDSIVMVGDFNADRDVNIQDLLLLISAWGSCEDDCLPDLDRNGKVDINDLLAFINVW